MGGQKRSLADAGLTTPVAPEMTPCVVTRSGKPKGGFSKGGMSKKGIPVPPDSPLELSHLRDAVRTVLSGHAFTADDADLWGWSVLFVNQCVDKVRPFP
mmetsp:Transcript_34700/g.82197  ORF Transcript_34700/g.82197 Transcript_34700/m.82197 type:complete len:99 (+) Transcript_34700:467-763(+)